MTKIANLFFASTNMPQMPMLSYLSSLEFLCVLCQTCPRVVVPARSVCLILWQSEHPGSRKKRINMYQHVMIQYCSTCLTVKHSTNIRQLNLSCTISSINDSIFYAAVLFLCFFPQQVWPDMFQTCDSNWLELIWPVRIRLWWVKSSSRCPRTFRTRHRTGFDVLWWRLSLRNSPFFVWKRRVNFDASHWFIIVITTTTTTTTTNNDGK